MLIGNKIRDIHPYIMVGKPNPKTRPYFQKIKRKGKIMVGLPGNKLQSTRRISKSSTETPPTNKIPTARYGRTVRIDKDSAGTISQG